jgi:hypothetical protein
MCRPVFEPGVSREHYLYTSPFDASPLWQQPIAKFDFVVSATHREVYFCCTGNMLRSLF